jgi:hypothetical protein
VNDQRPACSLKNVAAEGRKDLHEGLLEGFILSAGGEALHLPTLASRSTQEPTLLSQWWHRRAMINPLTRPTWCSRNGISSSTWPYAVQGLVPARSAIRVAPQVLHRHQSIAMCVCKASTIVLHCSPLFVFACFSFKTKGFSWLKRSFVESCGMAGLTVFLPPKR